jgi:CheY-like chemotaxis protein
MSADEHRLEGVCLLFVDDDSDTRDLYKALFETAGATVHVAPDASAAFSSIVE